MTESITYIEGIHNYCDRWCERCAFTDRCRAYEMERSLMFDSDDDISPETLVETLTNTFKEAKEAIITRAEEFGIELNTLSDDEFAAIRDREELAIEGDELTKLHREYEKSVNTVLNENDGIVDTSELFDAGDALDAIHHAHYQIGAKIHRVLGGSLDENALPDVEIIDDPMSDANGSCKVALLQIDRSINSWRTLTSDKNRAVIIPLTENLLKMRDLLEKRYPHARDFIRPGFDEAEMVM